MKDVITRKEWGARSFDGTPKPMDCTGIVVHHTAGRLDDGTRAGFIEEMQGIQDTHQLSNGWSDIGYHFVIGAGGHVAEGRPGSATLDWNVGAHAGGHNTGNVGICLMGCFHPPAGAWCGDEPTPEQIDRLTELVGRLMRYEGVRAENVIPHSDVSATACCGDLLRDQLPAIREEATRLERATGPTESTGSGADLIEEIEDRLDQLKALL